jgi:hypothetical protein
MVLQASRQLACRSSSVVQPITPAVVLFNPLHTGFGLIVTFLSLLHILLAGVALLS